MACSETSVCCYMDAEDNSTYGSGTFQIHAESHCMNQAGKGLCVCHDISDHKKRVVDISNCPYHRTVLVSFSHGYHENSFHQNLAYNEICESMEDHPSVTSYGGLAAYTSIDVEAGVGVEDEVGDEEEKAYAGN